MSAKARKQPELVPNRIRAMRMLYGMTPAHVAAAIGSTPHSVEHWEAGAPPNVAIAKRLMDLFDVTFEELFPPEWMLREDER